LVELTRKEIINRVKRDTKTRFRKRLDYSMEDVRVSDPGELYRGDFRAHFTIGDYEATIALEGFLDVLKRHLSPGDSDKYDRIRKALSEAVNETELHVHCTCDDFRYRFQYMATRGNYLATPPGQPENRPPDIRNPEREGAVCKHLAHLLNKPSEWYPYVVKYIRAMIDFDTSILEHLMVVIQEDVGITQYTSIVKDGDTGKKLHKPADLMSVMSNWISNVSGEYSINEEESTTVSLVFDININEDEIDEKVKQLNNNLNQVGYEVSEYSNTRIVISVK